MAETNAVLFGMPIAGTTAQRPTNAPHGFVYYDSDVGTLIVWDEDLDDWKVMATS